MDLDGPQYPVAPESKCEKGKGLKRMKDGTSKCRPNCQGRAVFQNTSKTVLSLSLSLLLSLSLPILIKNCTFMSQSDVQMDAPIS